MYVTLYECFHIVFNERNRNSCNETSTLNVLEINTQKFVNRDNFTQLELLIPETCTNTSHVSIHIYDQIAGGTPRIVILLKNIAGQLPSQEILTNTTRNSFIQLVGVENCSSRNNYYTFNGKLLEKIILTLEKLR